MDSIPLKRCTKCKREFPATIEYFRRQTAGKYGFRSTCRECCKQYDAQYRETDGYHEAIDRYRNTEHYAQIVHDYHRTSEYRERDKKRDRREYDRARYRKPHRHAQCQAQGKRSRQRNPAQIAQYKKNWYTLHKNEEKYKLKRRSDTQRRRARMKAAEGHFTPEDIKTLHRSQNGLCWWCGKAYGENYHIDHRIPLSKGGTNWPNNLCVACTQCNQSKGSKLPHEFNGRLL